MEITTSHKATGFLFRKQYALRVFARMDLGEELLAGWLLGVKPRLIEWAVAHRFKCVDIQITFFCKESTQFHASEILEIAIRKDSHVNGLCERAPLKSFLISVLGPSLPPERSEFRLAP